MTLTQYQQDMLDGRYGKGKALAMRVQKTIGEGFRAQRMVPITRAHVALSAQEADTWFARKLRNARAQCAVPPTVNPGYCLKYFQQIGCVDEKSSALMRETHQVYQDLGAILTYSCTPYLFGNIPRYGETVSFSETSVTVYANSVLGARTNRESSASALCAAITGFVPEYGMLLDENRLGTVLVQVDAPLLGEFDFALLGMNAKRIGPGVPVFAGIRALDVTTEALIALGAQLNVAGMADLFHMVGVILGCPHYPYEQVCRAARLLKQAPAAAPVWILTSAAVVDLARSTGLAGQLEKCGAELIPDTCVDEAPCWGHLAGQRGFTDSPKCAYYMRAFGVELDVTTCENCLALAAKGGKS